MADEQMLTEVIDDETNNNEPNNDEPNNDEANNDETNNDDKTNNNEPNNGETGQTVNNTEPDTKLVVGGDNEGAIAVFTPENFNIDEDDKQLEELVKSSAGAKVCPRAYRILAFICHAAFTMTLITYSAPDFHITKVLALGLAGMFITYFVHIYFLVGFSKTAHRIYSLSGTVGDWTTMPITYRQLIYRYEPIQSISEFSAIGGGIANQMLVVISTCSWVTILTQTLNNLWFEKIWLSFTDDLICGGCKSTTVNLWKGSSGIDAIILFIGAFGLVMIGIFELDPYSSALQNGHMTGVYLGFGCPVAFSIQQYFAVTQDTDNKNRFNNHKWGISFAVLFDITAVVFALIWTCYYNKKSDQLANKLTANPPKTEEEHKEAQKQIRGLTIRNVVAESVTLLAGSLTMCLWLWNYDTLNPSFQGGNPGVLPNGGPWFQYFKFLQIKYGCGDPNDIYVKTAPPTSVVVQYCSSANPTMAPVV